MYSLIEKMMWGIIEERFGKLLFCQFLYVVLGTISGIIYGNFLLRLCCDLVVLIVSMAYFTRFIVVFIQKMKESMDELD